MLMPFTALSLPLFICVILENLLTHLRINAKPMFAKYVMEERFFELLICLSNFKKGDMKVLVLHVWKMFFVPLFEKPRGTFMY